jgi:hypothetical protein
MVHEYYHIYYYISKKGVWEKMEKGEIALDWKVQNVVIPLVLVTMN